MNVNSIIMTEMHTKHHPIMQMKGEKGDNETIIHSVRPKTLIKLVSIILFVSE